MRGTRPRCDSTRLRGRFIPAHAGNSPIPCDAGRGSVRFIPAHAGNSASEQAGPIQGDHGSSPRMRGTHPVGSRWYTHRRPVHPRACGELVHIKITRHDGRRRFIPAHAGNSLSQPGHSRLRSHDDRFIPAHAGNSPVLSVRFIPAHAGNSILEYEKSNSGSSPRMRGTLGPEVLP